ncbi:carbohydrate binding family 9 domain-containing protein [bacterium]|nr:carbohydrate binding family 9 domain-containing protein [bacterium]
MRFIPAITRSSIIALLLIFSTAISLLAGQKSALRVSTLPKSFELDGRLSEKAWYQADSISALTMTEPFEGKQPSNSTIIKVLANSKFLVFGFRCLDNNPDKIVAFSKAKDSRLRSEDHIRLVLDTFMNGRSGYIFAVNPNGARYDALISNSKDGENSNWDAAWEAKTFIGKHGWSAEIKIPVKSLNFKKGLTSWGFNVERRIQRLQETDRWAGASQDYSITQISQAGVLKGLPVFDIGLGLSIMPSFVTGAGVPEPGADVEFTKDLSLDVSQKIGPNLQASLTINTDFAETEVDARRTNITRFPLFFPEKRTFFLEGSDIFEFGLGLRRDIVPFFSRKIGLLEGQQIPINAGGKIQGRVGNTNIGALIVTTGKLADVAPSSTMGVVRVKQNIFAESSVGIIATAGYPSGLDQSWLAGFDFTYKTSKFRGKKNFLVGLWGLWNHRQDMEAVQSSYGFKVDYPNNLWNISLTYKKIGDNFQPSLGFVPRTGVNIWQGSLVYSPRPSWPLVRQMFNECFPMLVTNTDNEWESYRLFMAPVNWRLESGDRFEFNIIPQGEKLDEPFEISDDVTISPGHYHWTRFRLEGGLAAKRKISGQVTWWFGKFYTGTLDQIELRMSINPSPVVNAGISGEFNYGRLKEGNFTQQLVACRLSINFSPDLQLSGFLQYDNESQTVGLNSKLRWIFSPLGDLFIVYNHNLAKSITDRWYRDSNQLLLKLRYGVRI